MYSCPDCCRGCLIVIQSALFLVISTIQRYLSFDSASKALAIAASSPEYRTCSGPRVEDTLFLAELLAAIHNAEFVSNRAAFASSLTVFTRLSEDAMVNGLVVTKLSMDTSLSISAT